MVARLMTDLRNALANWATVALAQVTHTLHYTSYSMLIVLSLSRP